MRVAQLLLVATLATLTLPLLTAAAGEPCNTDPITFQITKQCTAGFEGCTADSAITTCCQDTDGCVHLNGPGNPTCVNNNAFAASLDQTGPKALCQENIWQSGEETEAVCETFPSATYIERPGEEDRCCGNEPSETTQQCAIQDKSENGDCGAEESLAQCCSTSSCVDNNGACKSTNNCHSFGETGSKSFCSSDVEWRDPDEDEDFCTDNSCTDTEGQFVWNIGGTESPNSCCGDDDDEFARTCSDQSANGECSTNSDDTDACCTSQSSCVDSNGACAAQGQCALFGDNNHQSFCNQGIWQDPDNRVAFCESTSCTDPTQGLPTSGQFRFGIGGTAGSNLCCGDDPGEFVTICDDETDNGNCGTDTIACCGPNDCVDSNGACIATDSCSVFGTDNKKSFCDNGVWRDPDSDEDFCTDLSCSNDATPLSYDIPTGANTCCGDDDDENLLNRDCSTGVCATSTRDQGCCPQSDMCVFDGVCTASQSLVDIDGDGDREVCKAGTWGDPDQSLANCVLANNNPAPTEFLFASGTTNPICGFGSCDDATNNNQQFCCGDDEFEHFDQLTGACIKPTIPRGTTTLDCLDERGYFSEGAFFEDDICEAGRFTSRTRALATLLLDIANKTSPRNFSLFCDTPTNTLNYVEYLIQNQILEQDIEVDNYLSGIVPFSGTKSCQTNKGGTLFDTPCVNNICVLQLETNNQQQVIFATSLNRQIDQGTFPFIKTLEGVNSCDNAIGKDDGKFHRCITTSSKTYYNDVTHSLIYTDTELTSLPQQFEINILERFLTFLKNPHTSILTFVKTNQLTNQNIGLRDYSFIDQAVHFSRIYLERKGFKRVRGLSEKIPETNKEFMTIEYRGFDQDICETLVPIDEQARSTEGEFNRVLCKYTLENDVYQVFTNSSLGLSLWEELTAGLRTQDTGCSTNTRPSFEMNVPPIVALAIPSTFSAEIEVCLTPYTLKWEFIDVATGNIEQATALSSAAGIKERTTQTFLTIGPKLARLIIEDAGGTLRIQEQPFEVRGSPLCEVKDQCGDKEECIFELSSDENAAASLSCSSPFTKKVCCPDYYTQDPNNCEATPFRLTGAADAQTDNEGEASDLPTPLCLQSDIQDARCTLRDATATGPNINAETGCFTDETCLVKTSDTNNAHFESCENTNFENAICCSIGCGPLAQPGVDIALIGIGPFATHPMIARAAVDACNGQSFSFEWNLLDDTNNILNTFTGSTTTTTIEQEFNFPDTGTFSITITITDSTGKQATATQTFFVLPTSACSVRENTCSATENCIFSLSQKEDAHVARDCTSNFAYKVCCPNNLEPETTRTTEGNCPANTQTLLSLDKVFDSHAWTLDEPTIQTKTCMKTDLGTLSCAVRDAFNPEANAQEHGCRTNEVCVTRLDQEEDGHAGACVNPVNSLFPKSICCAVS